VSLLAPQTEKIFIPSGHLTLLDPAVKNELQPQRRIIQEVDTIEHAYQLMVRTR
jgi:hypothetical protein